MSRDKSWDEQAQRWAQFARSPQHDHFFWEFNGPRFLELLPSPGRTTLDVACGEGRLGRLLAERGHRVVAIDGSRSMARLAHDGGGQAVVVSDANALPFPDHAVDLVIAFMSLHDVPDLDRTVSEIARVLKPGDKFCMAIAHPIRSGGGFQSKESSSRFEMDSYFDVRPWFWSSQHTGLQITLPGTHRPLEAYTRALEHSGFVIEVMREPRPSKHQVARHPESARWQRIPCFLHIRAVLSAA
jgi:SAM-dependent methyltransferase